MLYSKPGSFIPTIQLIKRPPKLAIKETQTKEPVISLKNGMTTFEDFNKPFNSYRLTNYKLLCKEMPSSKVFLYEGSGSERFLLQSTNLLSTTSGIKIGDDIRVFKNKFSEKPDIFKTNIETYYCFPTCNLLFVVINEKIKSWLIYQASI